MESLMARYQAGDGAAFEALYRQLAPHLRRELLSLSCDAWRVDDLVQQAFLDIHRARRTYNPRSPLMPWVQAIVRRVVFTDAHTRVQAGS